MEDLSDMETKKGKPGWRDVKGALADFDRAGLLALVQDLYAASKDNQVFLHARSGIDADEYQGFAEACPADMNLKEHLVQAAEVAL